MPEHDKHPSVPVIENAKGEAVAATSKDAGNQPDSFYRAKILGWRYAWRQRFLPVIEWELEFLARAQSHWRHPWLDFYFAWTANLASHTFYVLVLPVPLWFGALVLLRDLVYLIGLGIYCTGFLKDLLCLPRPRLPPLHRITMLSYTTQEYGFPLSHLANATAVTLVLLFRVFRFGGEWLPATYWGTIAGLALYYFSLILGRIYCGMHGLFDIGLGMVVGIAMFAMREYGGAAWDLFLLDLELPWGAVVALIIVLGGALIHYYPEPADDCPCFDDSVAFIGVVMGLDLAHFVLKRTGLLAGLNHWYDPYLIYFDYSQLGVVGCVLRVLCGVVGVVVWKLVAKPVIFAILVPVYKRLHVWIPRRNYKSTAYSTQQNKHIRRMLVLNVGGSEAEFLHDVTSHPKDYVGPKGGVFKPRYDVEIVGRLIIYAGIPIMAVWGFTYTSPLVGVNCIDPLV